MTNATSSVRVAQRASLLDVEPGRFRYSAWRNITIGFWADQATLDAAQRVERVSNLMAKEHPRGHSSIVWVLDGAPAPTPEANEVFERLNNDQVSGLACVGLLIEGTGFWASRILSSITKTRMAASGNMLMRVSASPDALIEWFIPEHNRRTGAALRPEELKNVLVALRSIAANDNGEAAPLSRRPMSG